MSKRIVISCLLTIGVVACDSDDTLVSQVASLLGATSEHPCFEQFEHLFELNGPPADTRSVSEVIGGETTITEQYWYPHLQMIQFFTYVEGEDLCNNWNETGVSW